MRRLFIIRKDLNLSPGKLAAMVGHAAEGYWLSLLVNAPRKDLEFMTLPTETPTDPNYWKLYRAPRIRELAKAAHKEGKKYFTIERENPEKKFEVPVKIDKDIWTTYITGITKKTICECRNLNQLQKAKALALELGLKENIDFGFINDVCLTEIKPENEDGTCTVGMWFKPLHDEIAHKISKKFQLYRA